MKQTARDYYHARKGNCAQSVAHAWQTKHKADPKTTDAFAACGGGKAPDGLCGALHAAHTLAGDVGASAIRDAFARQTGGHLTCRDIRAARALPCAGCVELAAELLEQHGVKPGDAHGS